MDNYMRLNQQLDLLARAGVAGRAAASSSAVSPRADVRGEHLAGNGSGPHAPPSSHAGGPGRSASGGVAAAYLSAASSSNSSFTSSHGGASAFSTVRGAAGGSHGGAPGGSGSGVTALPTGGAQSPRLRGGASGEGGGSGAGGGGSGSSASAFAPHLRRPGRSNSLPSASFLKAAGATVGTRTSVSIAQLIGLPPSAPGGKNQISVSVRVRPLNKQVQ